MIPATPLPVPANNDQKLLIAAIHRDNTGHVSPYPLTDCDVELYIKASAFADDPAPIIATITNVDAGYAEVTFPTGTAGTRWRRIDVVHTDTNQRVTIDRGPLIVEAG